MFAIEINAVQARGLWPRSLCPPPLTPQDTTAYRLYAQVEQRHRESTWVRLVWRDVWLGFS